MWGIDLANSTLFLGYFESSFGVLAGLYASVLVLMLSAVVSGLWIASDRVHTGGAVGHFLKVCYVFGCVLPMGVRKKGGCLIT